MKNCPRIFAVVAAIVIFSTAMFARTTEEMVRDAVSASDAERAEAIAGLRALGREGLDSLAAAYSERIDAFKKTGDASGDWPRIAFALDSVAMQKDAYSSRLFWHTDLDSALAEAKRRNRPVLSLRLLGNLNEEFSCANSRFFRALLYSDPAIGDYLRENYVLHWRSVRPVPKVTIDFGDGRKLERTLTGNSIHYILSPDGDIIDALPGLYSAEAFLAYLKRGAEFSAKLAAMKRADQAAAIALFRRQTFDSIRIRRTRAIESAKVELREPKPDSTKAIEIAPLAVTKAITEAPILRDLDDNFSRFEPQIESAEWRRLAAAFAGETKIGEANAAFIRRQNPELNDEQFARMLANVRTLVALDTTRNDFYFHMQLLQRLNNSRRPVALEQFNSAVYTELFRTPDADKWLGLYSDEVYTGLSGNGIR